VTRLLNFCREIKVREEYVD